MRNIISALFLAVACIGNALAQPAVCYGTADAAGQCVAPALTVPPSALITLPADLAVSTDQQATLIVSLNNAQWFGTPQITGGTVFSAGASLIAVTCAEACVIALPPVSGAVPGTDITANVRLFSPNGTTQLFFDGQITLAHVLAGAIPPPPGSDTFSATAWVLNPASNIVQRTFLRIVAPGDAAQVVIYATDDSGAQRGPVIVSVPAGGAVQLTAADIEQGNPLKGIAVGVGAGVGKWRIDTQSATLFRLFALSTGLAELPVE